MALIVRISNVRWNFLLKYLNSYTSHYKIMKWLKPFLRKESNKVAKEPDNRNNPQEEIMKRITKQMGETISDDFFKKYPLNLFSYGDKYYIADGKGIHLDLDFRKEDIIKALKENNDDIKKAFHALLGEKPVIKKYVSKTKSPEEQLIERMIQSEEIANMAVSIIKNDAMTGEIVVVDGGISLKTV